MKELWQWPYSHFQMFEYHLVIRTYSLWEPLTRNLIHFCSSKRVYKFVISASLYNMTFTLIDKLRLHDAFTFENLNFNSGRLQSLWSIFCLLLRFEHLHSARQLNFNLLRNIQSFSKFNCTRCRLTFSQVLQFTKLISRYTFIFIF